VSRTLRWLVPAALAILSGLERLAAQAAPAADSVGEPVLLQLELGRLASRTIAGLQVGYDVLLPLSDVLDLAEIRSEIGEHGQIEIMLQPGNRRVEIDPAARQIKAAGAVTPLAPGELIERDGVVYLERGLLGSLLGVDFQLDWTELTVAVADPGRLPIGRRVAREATRAQIYGTRAEGPEVTLGLDRGSVTGAVLDYSLLTPLLPVQGRFEGVAFASGLGLDVGGGSFQVGVATADQSVGSSVRVDASWTGVWREQPWLTQLRVGDGLSTGPRPRTVRGFSITNSPYLRPSVVGNMTYTGQLGPGWEIEAYRGGRLIALDSANAVGQYSFDLPVQYGENAVDFVAYGPFGEVREFNRNYRVTQALLPQRKLEYGVALGACRTPLCQATGNLDLRYGVSRRWTIGGGVEQFWRQSDPNLFHPYALVSGSFSNAWSTQVQAVGRAVLQGVLNFEPSADLRVTAEYDHFATGTPAPVLTVAGRRNQFTVDGFARPIKRSGSLYLTYGFDRIEAVTGLTTSGRLGASVMAGPAQLMPSYRVQRAESPGAPSQTTSFVGMNAIVLPQLSLGSFLGKISGRAFLEAQPGVGLSTAAGYLARPVVRGLRLETGAGWNQGAGATFSLTLATELPSLRGYTTVNASSGGTSAIQWVQGSVLYDPTARQVDFSWAPGATRAGLTGRVFLDLNGNGTFDTGEQLLPGVRVRAGMTQVQTDSSGRYRIWDLSPYDPVEVAVDSLSLPSPLWVPQDGVVSVEPGPNSFRDLDIPIAPGGTLEGRVARESIDGLRGMAGIPLVLTDLRSGVTRGLTTFSDGEFYAIGIRPGRYQLAVSPEVLARLNLVAPPLQVTMPAAADGATVGDLELTVTSISGPGR
jgi:hypothetical protein